MCNICHTSCEPIRYEIAGIEMLECPNCGHKRKAIEDNNFCPNCGLELDCEMYCGNCNIYWEECPDCGLLLTLYPNDIYPDGIYLCPKCNIKWTACPECIKLVDIDTNWNYDQELCYDCQNENGRGV